MNSRVQGSYNLWRWQWWKNSTFIFTKQITMGTTSHIHRHGERRCAWVL